MHQWDLFRFHKMRARIRYDEPAFLHLVGFAGHVVHFGASGARNIDILFFKLGWDQYRFHKNHVGTHYADGVFLHPMEPVHVP
jgi:hypothetical protein